MHCFYPNAEWTNNDMDLFLPYPFKSVFSLWKKRIGNEVKICHLEQSHYSEDTPDIEKIYKIEYGDKKMDVILVNLKEEDEEDIGKWIQRIFDIECCKCLWRKDEISCLSDWKDMIKKRTKITRDKTPIKTYKRGKKYKKRGFKILNWSEFEERIQEKEEGEREREISVFSDLLVSFSK